MKKYRLLAACMAALMLVGCTEVQPEETQPLPELRVDVLDIGKADCIVITVGEHCVVIDAGEEDNFSDIRKHLDSLGVEAVDHLILTHYDKDHIGGAAKLIRNYDVACLLESAFSSDSDAYDEYHEAMADRGKIATILLSDYSFTLDSCEFTVYVPQQSEYGEKEDNNSSLIVEMRYGNRRFLFCGDAMELRLEEFLAGDPGQFDVIKLPYHGNWLENYSRFLAETTPEYGIITCSKKNPADEDVLELLEQQGVAVFQTRRGTVTVTTDGNDLEVIQD